MYLGYFKVRFAIPGYSGTARCMVVAYPGAGGTVRVITVVTDATINGKWSTRGVSMANGRFYQDIQTEGDEEKWLNMRNPGDPVRIFIEAGSGPGTDLLLRGGPLYSGMRDLILATYPGRFEADLNLMKEVAGDLEFPDPYDIFQWLDPQKDVGLIGGIGDPLNK